MKGLRVLGLLVFGVMVGLVSASPPATAQVLDGPRGAPTTRAFPNSRVLPIPTPPFVGTIQLKWTPNLGPGA